MSLLYKVYKEAYCNCTLKLSVAVALWCKKLSPWSSYFTCIFIRSFCAFLLLYSIYMWNVVFLLLFTVPLWGQTSNQILSGEITHRGVYMFMQQSAAFKILRTRLKTVPFSENIKRTSSANPYSQILQVTEDGNRNQDTQNYSAINFPSLLQQFEHMQLQHRNHLKDQLQSRKSASTLTLSQVFSAFAHIFDYAIYMIWVVIAAVLPQKKQLLKLSVVCSCSTYVQKYLVFLILSVSTNWTNYYVVSFLL